MILWRQEWENKLFEMNLIPRVMVNKKKHLSPVLEKHFVVFNRLKIIAFFLVHITIYKPSFLVICVYKENMIDTRALLSAPPN